MPPDLPDSVVTVSPDFKKHYMQAFAAEYYGLDAICGVGLRKALKFFVKYYLIAVSKRIEVDDRVQQCLLRFRVTSPVN